ncbi:hypothetical protein HZF02_28130 [Pseudomonas yamanorum]|nr:hypothetical protein HZF02_28130 [Pseudomonas yamanorum]
MVSLHVKVNGVLECENALERLISGKPNVAAHVGLDLSRLTAAIVSYEAGFDRGYLKKSRKPHLALIAKIEACRRGVVQGAVSISAQNKLMSSIKKIKRLEQELSIACSERDTVLTQNLQLWERVRQLESMNLENKVLSIHGR